MISPVIAPTDFTQLLDAVKISYYRHFSKYLAARKTSHERLYKALAQAYRFSESVRSDSSFAYELDRVLKQQDIKIRENSSTEAKCLKALYSYDEDMKNRVYAWADVLKNAHDKEITAENFVEWLKDQGGIDKASKSHRKTSQTDIDPPDSTSNDQQSDQGDPEEFFKSRRRIAATHLGFSPRKYEPGHVAILGYAKPGGEVDIIEASSNTRAVNSLMRTLKEELLTEPQPGSELVEEDAIQLDPETTIKSGIPFTKIFAPKTLDDVVFPNETSENIVRQIAEGKLVRHLILYGRPGGGKTTIARLLPTVINGTDKVDVREINASDERGIDDARKFAHQARLRATNQCGRTFFILDECEKLTKEAQALLKGPLEDYISNSQFFMTMNSIENVDPAIWDRAEHLCFDQFDKQRLQKRATEINEFFGNPISQTVISQIVDRSGGSLRTMINELEKAIKDKNLVTKAAAE